jgi:phosphoribosylglycinamide formyltransferase-1
LNLAAAMYHPGNTEVPLRLGIITYDHAHLKTEQLLHRLLLKKNAVGRELCPILLALPFSPRPSRSVLLAHRPDQEKAVSARELAAYYGLTFLSCTYDSIPDVADFYLIAGGGILSAGAIGNKKIINSHPGIIPSVRGLDAFKWSIFDGIPLGVTLHYIDPEVDAGETIAIVRTPIFKSDTVEVLARRHYELELDVASEFLTLLDRKSQCAPCNYPENAARMRMPIKTERDMIAKFDEYKKRFSDHVDF